jgi:hypothetical protein
VSQLEVLQAYAQGEYEGNLLDLFGNRGYPVIRNLSIPNSALNGAWEAMWSNCLSGASCDGCDYCRDLVERVLAEQSVQVV